MSTNDRDMGYYDWQTTKWIVLDDDVDTLWIESMNTVMDANKMLTLVSNERIPLTPAMRVVCEIDSIDNGSPATVSRNGMLYINETDIGWRPYVDRCVCIVVVVNVWERSSVCFMVVVVVLVL